MSDPTDGRLMPGSIHPRGDQRGQFCCLCGEPRKVGEPMRDGIGNHDCITMAEHRELKPGRWEVSPQLMAHVGLWRNGGTAPGQTHICDGCTVVGLQAAKRFVDAELTKLNDTAGVELTRGGER
jgi:hypothetical protein